MDVKLNTPIMTLDDTPMPRKNGKGNETFRTIAMHALTAVDEAESLESAENKLTRFELAMTLKNCKNESLSITTDEAVMIKTRVNRFYGALVFGQIHHMIEGGTSAPETNSQGQGA